ncbi:MAG: heavy metal translocating P-type ATPase [Candidatus Promineifilaceae bacterium]
MQRPKKRRPNMITALQQRSFREEARPDQLPATLSRHGLEKERAIKHELRIASASLVFAVLNPFVSLPLGIVAMGGTLYALQPICKEITAAFIREGKTDARALPILGALGVMLTGHYIVAAGSYLAFAISEKLILYTEDRSRQTLINIIGEQPKFVWRLQDGVEIKIPFEVLQVDDVVAVSAGQTIPIDGEVVSGMGMVDQQRLTGEAQPVEREIGDPVLAATMLLSGSLHVRAQTMGSETVAAQIGSILDSTLDYRANSLLRFQALSNRLTIPALALAGLASAVHGFTMGAAMIYGLPISVIAAASSLNILGYLNQASGLGVLVKDGRALEQLQAVDTIVFDKTGTLTLEQPTVGEIVMMGDFSAEKILQFAASAETKQSHPIAQAILAAAEARGIPLLDLDHTRLNIGYGLDVHVNNHHVLVGSRRYIELEEIAIPDHMVQHATKALKQGVSLVYVAVDGQLAGAIELHATIRPEAEVIIGRLQSAGIQLAIISGDRQEPTQLLALQLGIDTFYAEVLPQEKSRIVEQLQADGRKVCFIGDGINDTIALKQADASVSLAGATSAATDTAQMVLMDGNLNSLPALVDLSKQFYRNTNRTVASAITLPMFAMVAILFAQGGLPLAVACNFVGCAAGFAVALQPIRERKQLPSQLLAP